MPTPPQTQLIQILVSSPQEVQAERELVDEVVGEINRSQARGYGVRLETIRWEQDVVPQIGPPPQDGLREQLPAYGVYLGIMAGRFGTPVDGTSGKYGSGTEQEFEDALARWRGTGQPWILFYFQEKPAVSLDDQAIEQLALVKKFRDRVREAGLYVPYDQPRGDSPQSFRRLVDRHLRTLLQFLFASLRDETLPELPAEYLRWLERKCLERELFGGLDVKGGQGLKLQHVYVPLCTEHAAREGSSPLLNLLGERSLYVPGHAGSGKSTFCRWVAYVCCRGEIPEQAAPAPESCRELFPADFTQRLPVLILLRDFWTQLPRDRGRCELLRGELETALANWFGKQLGDAAQAELLRAHLKRGTALLLFDGVDEVPLADGDDRCSPRAMLLAGLADAIPTWTAAGNRLLVTSRPYGLQKTEVARLRLPIVSVADLDDDRRELLMRRWFHTLEGTEPGESFVRDLQMEIGARPDLAPLLAQPMLLTSLCVLFGEGKRLPQDRHELYDRLVNHVLHNRYPGRSAEVDLERRRLSVIALGMHSAGATPRTVVSHDELERFLRTYQASQTHTEGSDRNVLVTRERLLSHSGLLLPRGTTEAEFSHLTIQEFLAAQRLLNTCDEALADVFRARAETAEWRMTLAFLFGLQVARNADDAVALLRDLLAETTLQRLGLSVVLGDGIDILLGREIRLQPEDQTRFQQLCVDAIAQEVAVRPRLSLSLVLGRLGDPRVVDDLRNNPAPFREVPAGKYFFGEQKKPYELTESVWLSRFPVTNAQFAHFVRDGGYEREALWEPAGWSWLTKNLITEPEYWRNPKWHGPTQPVVGVSWWEADAFARWLGGRLPTEREWEAAARGPTGREFPWGDDWRDDLCNTEQTKLEQTSPVGMFPGSQSVSGHDDLAGNVWEWCADWYDSKSKQSRVLRGGSWSYHWDFARSANRRWNHPDDRNCYVGFRVVCVASGLGNSCGTLSVYC